MNKLKVTVDLNLIRITAVVCVSYPRLVDRSTVSKIDRALFKSKRIVSSSLVSNVLNEDVEKGSLLGDDSTPIIKSSVFRVVTQGTLTFTGRGEVERIVKRYVK